MSNVESLSEDERSLLCGHDDDFYGLWEVDWHFNGRRPEWSREERITLVSSLVRRGFFEVFFGPLQTEQLPLEVDAALEALTNPSAWMPPLEGQAIGYYVTTSAASIAAQRQSL